MLYEHGSQNLSHNHMKGSLKVGEQGHNKRNEGHT